MKIIMRSNFDHDTVSDVLFVSGLSILGAHRIVKILNSETVTYQSPYIYAAELDDYKLYEWKP